MDEPPFRFEIREAEVLDASALAMLRVASELERYPERAEHSGEAFVQRSIAYFQTQLGRTPTVVHAWLATVDATVVGSAVLTLATALPRPMDVGETLDGRIRSVYVDPRVRRRGIASALARGNRSSSRA